MLKFITASFIFTLPACNQPKLTAQTKTLDFGLFTIETPQSWSKVNVQGLDSYVGDIAIGSNDTLSFDLGWYSDNLTEYQKFEMPDGKPYYISTYDTSKSSPFLDSIDMIKLVKSNVSYDTIDGKRAKILTPKKSGTGITGVYIDNLWKAGSNRDRFNLYGLDLEPENEKEFLKALRTLKFHKK